MVSGDSGFLRIRRVAATAAAAISAVPASAPMVAPVLVEARISTEKPRGLRNAWQA